MLKRIAYCLFLLGFIEAFPGLVMTVDGTHSPWAPILVIGGTVTALAGAVVYHRALTSPTRSRTASTVLSRSGIAELPRPAERVAPLEGTESWLDSPQA